MGCVVYIDDATSNVRDLVILNPQWLSDVMASLVNVRYEQSSKQVLCVGRIQFLLNLKHVYFFSNTVGSLVETC